MLYASARGIRACLADFIACALVLPQTCFADLEPTPNSTNTSYLHNFLLVPREVGREVYQRTRQADPVALAAWGAIGAAFLLDETVRESWHRNIDSPRVDRVSNWLYHSGTPMAGQVGIGAALIASWVLDDRELMNTAALVTQSALLTQIITEAVKAGSGRARPNESDGDAGRWQEGGASFFSGHASGTWGAATVIAHRYPDGWIPPLAYGWATAVSLSRINDDGHWTSDVVMGSLFGYLIGRSVVRLNTLNDEGSVRFVPMLDDDVTGIGFELRF